jgi:hypothetical protein
MIFGNPELCQSAGERMCQPWILSLCAHQSLICSQTVVSRRTFRSILRPEIEDARRSGRLETRCDSITTSSGSSGWLRSAESQTLVQVAWSRFDYRRFHIETKLPLTVTDASITGCWTHNEDLYSFCSLSLCCALAVHFFVTVPK